MSEQIELTPGNVKASMRSAGASSSDLWMVPRAQIRVLPGFNVRARTPDYERHIRTIGESILANGYRKDKPMAGYVAKDGDEHIIYLTDGHSRLEAVDYACERGAEIELLPVVTSPAGTSMEDLTIGLVTSNSGRPLTPIETAAVCKRLVGYGMETPEIARRLTRTTAYVNELLALCAAPSKVRKMVEAGQVSAGNAVRALKKHGPKAAEVLGAQLTAAQSRGQAKVTAKTLAPKRDLLADGVSWLKANGWTTQPDARLVGLLATLTGRSEDEINALLEQEGGDA